MEQEIEKIKDTMRKLVGHLKGTRATLDETKVEHAKLIAELGKVLTTHAEKIHELTLQVSELKNSPGGAPKLPRRPLNKEYNALVQECLDEDPAMSKQEISDITGIPKSTVYKYLKLTPEEVSTLPDK